MDQSPRSVPRSSRYRFSEDRSETSEVSSFVRDSKQLETHASRFRQRERDDSEEVRNAMTAWCILSFLFCNRKQAYVNNIGR